MVMAPGQKETAQASAKSGPFYVSRPSASLPVTHPHNTAPKPLTQRLPFYVSGNIPGSGAAPRSRAAASLDILASKVSLAPKEGAEAPKPAHMKKTRHRLRQTAGQVLGGRVKHCGHTPIGGSMVSVVAGTHGGHHFTGLETCGSVWVCPVCAVKITEDRRSDVKAVLEGHLRGGGMAVMYTLTMPHHAFQSCEETRKAIAQGWQKVQAGAGWKAAKDRLGVVGYIRALEVTHGVNGWHPHLHVVVLFRKGYSHLTEVNEGGFAGWLFERWSRVIARLGFGACSENGFSAEAITDAEGVSKYCQKWGAAEELTKAHVKMGRNGGRTPWQILSDISDTGDSRDMALFREYADAFKGARQLTWSRGLRDRFLNEPERPDEDIAAEPECADLEEARVAFIDRDLWKEITGRMLPAEILTGADLGGLEGIAAVLDRFSIPHAIGRRMNIRGHPVPVFLPLNR